jgi:hypothetical protein
MVTMLVAKSDALLTLRVIWNAPHPACGGATIKEPLPTSTLWRVSSFEDNADVLGIAAATVFSAVMMEDRLFDAAWVGWVSEVRSVERWVVRPVESEALVVRDVVLKTKEDIGSEDVVLLNRPESLSTAANACSVADALDTDMIPDGPSC